MRQRLVLPPERDDDLVVPEGWVEMAKEHWRMFLPKRYARLQVEGKLEEEAQKAACFTADAMREAMEDSGCSEPEAWQAHREDWIFLPSEDDQPEPWSLNLDPDAIIQALTRVCGHYYDDGVTDFEPWAVAIREAIAEEIGPYLEKAWEAVTGQPPASPKRSLSWNDIRNVARSIFDVWIGQPELKWARNAWAHLRAKGLTSYCNETERTMVLVRLGTLALMYREFCELAFDEREGDFDFVDWDRLGIDTSSLAHLIPRETQADEEDDSVDTYNGLQELSQRVRPEIYEALKEGFGDDSMLFASLWRTASHESLEDTVNDVTAEKAEAFSWICEGMGELR